MALLCHDHPDRVNNTRNEAQDRQQDVEPEMAAEPNLQEDAQRRDEERNDDANDVYGDQSSCRWLFVFTYVFYHIESLARSAQLLS
jgi:hypothetical protein